MGKKIIVVKDYRSSKPADIAIAFPKFDNLHLELLEDKKKLKKGLPLIPLKKLEAKPLMQLLETDNNGSVSEKRPISDNNGTVEPVKKVKNRDVSISEVKKTVQIKEPVIQQDVQQDVHTDVQQDVHTAVNLEELYEDTDANVEEGDLQDTFEDPQDHVDDQQDHQEQENTYIKEPDDGLTPEEREANEREEYIWRFKILKKSHKDRSIPEYNEFSDVRTMKLTYDRTIKDIYLEESINSYKTYLSIGVIAMEYAFVKYLGMDMNGFAASQLGIMSKYDRFLIELGQKSYSTFGSNMPVEARLLGFMMMQAFMFYIGKRAGPMVAALLDSLNNGKSIQEAFTESKEEEPKKKMRGPRVKAADIAKDIET